LVCQSIYCPCYVVRNKFYLYLKMWKEIDKYINEKLDKINYKLKLLIIGVAYLVGITIRMLR